MKGLKGNISSKEKSIHVIEFFGKKSDWDGWLEKFLAKADFKGYQKLRLYKKIKVEYNKVPTTGKINAIVLKNELNCSKEDKHFASCKINHQVYMELMLLITIR